MNSKEAESSMFIVSEAWRNAYPGAAVGILMMRDVDNPDNCPVLDRHRIELENQLRTRFAHCDRADLNFDEQVDYNDLLIICQDWLAG